jgi:protein-disulfide isomerase
MTKSATSRNARSRQSASNNIGIWIIGIAAVIVLAVVLIVAFSNRPAATAIAAPDVQPAWLNGTVIGDPNAPVTIEAWEDFLCPACRQWTETVEPQIVEQYVKTGQVKLEFRQFPLTSHAPGSIMGAMASLCANDQNAFWPYHSRLFMAQDQGQAGYTIDALVRYADDLGLDSRALLECMSSQKYRDAVNASASEAAVTRGYGATPTIVVNGEPMANPYDMNELAALINAGLGN